MKKNYLIYAVAVGLLLAYLIIINVVANIVSSESSVYNNVEKMNNGDVVLGLGDSVAVSVVRNRWYGTILEESRQTTKLSKLYLLGFIALPLNVNGSNLFWVHLIFIVLILGATYLGVKKMKKYYFERGHF